MKRYSSEKEIMDQTEFTRLAKQYMDTVYAIAINSCKNPMDAEDIVQNTFLKFLYTDEVFENDENAKRWLIRVTVNETHSLFRSTWKKKVVFQDEDSKWHSPSENRDGWNLSEEESALYDAMHEIPQDYRTVIHLFYFEEYSTKEIAEILELSEANVRKRLSRGRRALRQILDHTSQSL